MVLTSLTLKTGISVLSVTMEKCRVYYVDSPDGSIVWSLYMFIAAVQPRVRIKAYYKWTITKLMKEIVMD